MSDNECSVQMMTRGCLSAVVLVLFTFHFAGSCDVENHRNLEKMRQLELEAFTKGCK